MLLVRRAPAKPPGERTVRPTGPITPTPDSMNSTDCRAWLFDLDGVLTRTADIHAAAWKRGPRSLLLASSPLTYMFPA